VRLAFRQILPLAKIECGEVSVLIAEYDLSVILKKETDSPADRADVDRLPQPVEDQNRFIQRRRHKAGIGADVITGAQKVSIPGPRVVRATVGSCG